MALSRERALYCSWEVGFPQGGGQKALTNVSTDTMNECWVKGKSWSKDAEKLLTKMQDTLPSKKSSVFIDQQSKLTNITLDLNDAVKDFLLGFFIHLEGRG